MHIGNRQNACLLYSGSVELKNLAPGRPRHDHVGRTQGDHRHWLVQEGCVQQKAPLDPDATWSQADSSCIRVTALPTGSISAVP